MEERYYDGKQYINRTHDHHTKAEAEADAERQRREGRLVRIVKCKYGYKVYSSGLGHRKHK